MGKVFLLVISVYHSLNSYLLSSNFIQQHWHQSGISKLHDEYNYTALVCDSEYFLIFYVVGKITNYTTLNYKPPYTKAVSCCSRRIVVAKWCPPAVYIHSWDGSHIQVLSHQHLQLQEDDVIHAVQCVDDDRLILAVGDHFANRSLHVYRVSYL